MSNDNTRINDILALLHLINSKFDSNNQARKILLVEGQTDVHFIKDRLLKNDVIYEMASQTKPGHCKEVIIGLLDKLLEGFPFPTIHSKWSQNKVFGMIDKDFDNDNDYEKIKKQLFMTDTHDLETLMLKTEENLLQKIEIKDCKIEDKDVKIEKEDETKALFIAYQLGTMRKLFLKWNEKIPDKSSNKLYKEQKLFTDRFADDFEFFLSNKKRKSSAKPDKQQLFSSKISLYGLSVHKGKDVDYSKFVSKDDCQISLKKLISYLIKRSSEDPNKTREQLAKQPSAKKLSELLAKDESIEEYLYENEERTWKFTLDSFKVAKPADLWDVVNGHDILSLLRYVNEKVNEKYKPKHELDRSFEIALIDAYDPDNFKDTNICKRMVAEGIVKADQAVQEN